MVIFLPPMTYNDMTVYDLIEYINVLYFLFTISVLNIQK